MVAYCRAEHQPQTYIKMHLASQSLLQRVCSQKPGSGYWVGFKHADSREKVTNILALGEQKSPIKLFLNQIMNKLSGTATTSDDYIIYID